MLLLAFIFWLLPLTIALCPPNSVLSGNDICYTSQDSFVDRDTANTVCQVPSGRLPRPNSAYGNSLYNGLVNMLEYPAIFLEYTSNGFSFVDNDGNVANYTLWDQNEPSTIAAGTVIALYASSGRWRAVSPSLRLPTICSVPSVCTQSKKQKPLVESVATTTVAYTTTRDPHINWCAENYRDVKNPCADGWTYFPRTCACYKVLGLSYFSTAETACHNSFNNAHLASIHSYEEMAFIYDAVRATNTTWALRNSGQDNAIIGLKLINNEWQWTDGTPFDFRDMFAPGEYQSDFFGTIVTYYPPGFGSYVKVFDCQSQVCQNAVCKYRLY